jgi:hypothetical protein
LRPSNGTDQRPGHLNASIAAIKCSNQERYQTTALGKPLTSRPPARDIPRVARLPRNFRDWTLPLLPPLVGRPQLGDDHCMEKDEISIGVAADVRARAAPAAREEVLQIAPRIYREYANEFKELSRKSESEPQRDIYLKAAQMWLDAATLFEFETGYFGSGRELQKSAA